MPRVTYRSRRRHHRSHEQPPLSTVRKREAPQNCPKSTKDMYVVPFIVDHFEEMDQFSKKQKDSWYAPRMTGKEITNIVNDFNRVWDNSDLIHRVQLHFLIGILLCAISLTLALIYGNKERSLGKNASQETKSKISSLKITFWVFYGISFVGTFFFWGLHYGLKQKRAKTQLNQSMKLAKDYTTVKYRDFGIKVSVVVKNATWKYLRIDIGKLPESKPATTRVESNLIPTPHSQVQQNPMMAKPLQIQ